MTGDDALTRRGAAEAMQLTHQLAAAVDSVRGALCKHMRREELEVLPLLQAHLCDAEQRSMVWRMLRAMPLRLLTRVMPVVAGMGRFGRAHTIFDLASVAHVTDALTASGVCYPALQHDVLSSVEIDTQAS